MSYSAIVSFNFHPDARGLGMFPSLDWAKSVNGVASTWVASGSPWVVQQTSAYGWMGDVSITSETDPIGSTYQVEVGAAARTDCAGWTLSKWCVARETAPGVFQYDQVTPQGQTLIAPVTVLANYQGHIYIFPYFTFAGTGRLLGTPTGDALVGCADGNGAMNLVVDL